VTATPRRLFGIALKSEGRGVALAGATALLIVHALAEATIPVIIGATIDRAVLPADPVALAIWIGVLVGTFLVLTVSYQSASRLMVSIYGYGEQALRHLSGVLLHTPTVRAHELAAAGRADEFAAALSTLYGITPAADTVEDAATA